jgi:hypothetical protein
VLLFCDEFAFFDIGMYESLDSLFCTDAMQSNIASVTAMVAEPDPVMRSGKIRVPPHCLLL